MSLEEFFRDIEERSIPTTIAYVRENVAIAKRYGILVIAYEGGRHLNAGMHGVGDAPPPSKRASTRRSAIRGWRGRIRGSSRNGTRPRTMRLFCTSMSATPRGPFGRWGLLEYIDQPREEAPKYDAVMKWMEEK